MRVSLWQKRHQAWRSVERIIDDHPGLCCRKPRSRETVRFSEADLAELTP